MNEQVRFRIVPEELGRAAERPAFLGHPVLLTPLPRRVRARLAVGKLVDRAAIWLVDRGRYGTALWLWRGSGLLKGRKA